jgi:hypothetical protein
VIGTAAEKVAPVSVAWSSDRNHGPEIDLVGRVVLVLAADPQVQWCGDELHWFGDDPFWGEGLEGELAGEDVAAAVAPDVQDQPVSWQQTDEPDELFHELRRVVDAEGEDAQMADDARGCLDAAGPEDTRHAGRHVLPNGAWGGGEGRGLVGLGLAGRLRREQQGPGPAGLVGVQVDAEAGGAGADLVEVAPKGGRFSVTSHG